MAAPLAGWDAAALTLLGWTWRSLWPMDATRTASHATRENPSRAYADLILLSGSLVSLVAVGLVLVRASHETGLTKGLLVGMSVASIVLAWAVVHTVYTLRYAKGLLRGQAGGCRLQRRRLAGLRRLSLSRADDRHDLVSDTNLTAKAFRRTALRHAVLSYICTGR